ncbi:hypothetical protein [Variovorax sp. UMC13]|uniref:hypothetical protein n=1 Tax=Variovorax sp. UMC13 TaxID=1862326 RepID=UPI0015FF43DB|nr:hypothetical protein [Variovorax sp. UMC13]MBB1601064.1 hypothetical protein [Variovorax sp. UMC13]
MFFKPKSAQAASDFIARLKTTPVVQEALREIEAGELVERQALIAERDALLATLGTFMGKRTKRQAEINAEILAIEQRRTDLGNELLALDCTGSSFRSTTGRDLDALASQIKAGADPRINNFVVWAQFAHAQAVEHTWRQSGQSKLYAVERGSEARVALDARLGIESVARLARLVGESLERAEAMRMEAAMPDDVLLELQSMAAAIHAEYTSQPRSPQLSPNFLARIPGFVVLQVNEFNEAVEG